MSLWKIAWRSIQHRSLASGLTAFSMSLGVALIVTVIVIYGVLERSFSRSAQGYDMIVGPKGSSLELVISTVFYQREPIGKIPYEYYTELRSGRYRSWIEAAIPITLGEHYRGFPVVATTSEFFSKLEYMVGDRGRKYTFRSGENFSDARFYDAVIGYNVASKTRLKVGDTFKTMHGKETAEEHQTEYTIVGILDPTGTPNDGALFINIEGFFDMHAGQDSILDEGFRLKRETPVLPSMKPAEPSARFSVLREPFAQESDPSAAEILADFTAEELEIMKALAEQPHKDHDHTDHEHGETAEHADHSHTEDANHVHDGNCDHDHAEHTDHDHAETGEVHVHDEHCGHSHIKEVSAVLVLTKEAYAEAKTSKDIWGREEDVSLGGSLTRSVVDVGIMALPNRIEEDLLEAQVVHPSVEITTLFEKIIGNIQIVLLILAALVIVVAGIGMMVSIYNSMSERRQEIAIMRALGAKRITVMSIILLESILLSLGGGALGVLIGHSLIFVLGPWISSATGIIVSAWHFQWTELILIPGLVALASVVGYLPAVIAYRTDVAQSLQS